MINRKLSLAPRWVLNVFTAIVGLGLLAALVFSLNALFASRTHNPRKLPTQAANQPQQQVPISPSTTPTIAQYLESALVESGDWNKYVSEVGKYSISYPPNWMPIREYSENGGVIFGLAKPADDHKVLRIGVSVAPLPAGWELKQAVDRRVETAKDSPYAYEVQAKGDISVDGEKAVEIVGREEFLRMIEVVVTRDKVLYTLWAQPYDPEHPMFGKWVSDLDLLFHAMVGSVRFLD